MIKISYGHSEIDGLAPVILSELTVAIVAVRDSFEERYGKEMACKMVDCSLALSKMSEEDLDKKFDKSLSQLDEIFRGGGRA